MTLAVTAMLMMVVMAMMGVTVRKKGDVTMAGTVRMAMVMIPMLMVMVTLRR